MLAVAVPAGAGSRHDRSESIVIANRGSGDLSVIDAASLDVTTIPLPGAAEPMYVSHDARANRVLVGDRASSAVVALDDQSFDVIASVPVGEGVFHQWLDARLGQLWVVGTTSTSVTVVDSRQLEAVATIPLPADLVARGGVPHDVFVKGRHAFVSVLGLDDGTGAVVQYSTRTFSETGRITTGDDPHLFVRGNRLYVASQDASSVSVHRAGSLRLLNEIAIPSAHGIFVTPRGDVLVTNIAGGGTDAVWQLNHRLSRIEAVADTATPVPHNIAAGRDGTAYITHSGATADQVTVIERSRSGFGSPTSVTVGTNPFGLAVVSG